MNTLYYGDDMNILRPYIREESVDLVYVDPPFNSNRNYTALFKDESGLEGDMTRFPKCFKRFVPSSAKTRLWPIS